jgi:hypothetical protein
MGYTIHYVIGGKMQAIFYIMPPAIAHIVFD